MFRSGDFFYSKDEGLAVLISKGVYGKSFSQNYQGFEKKAGTQGFFKRLFWSKEAASKEHKDPKKLETLQISNKRKLSEDVDDQSNSMLSRVTRVKKSLKPNSEMLKKLNLQYGMNKITYRVHTQLQGIQELSGSIFLLKKNTSIVVSDVDGTITKY